MNARLCLALALSCGGGHALAATEPGLPGKLFYTPAERAMLVNARSHKITELKKTDTPSDSAPLSFDGVVTRSDGTATHWINGKAHTGRASPAIRDLKPGQIRADKKVYEPYQVLRPGAPVQPPAPPLAQPPDTTPGSEAAP